MNKNKETSYLKIIKDLSEDIGISKEETKSLVDIALSSSDLKHVNYEELKDEIIFPSSPRLLISIYDHIESDFDLAKLKSQIKIFDDKILCVEGFVPRTRLLNSPSLLDDRASESGFALNKPSSAKDSEA